MIEAEVSGRDFSPLRKQEETAGGLAVDVQNHGGAVGCVIHVVNRAGNEGRLSTKHVERRLHEAVVNVAVVGHVNAEVGGMMAKLKVEPDASNVAGTHVGRERVEAENRGVERRFYALLQ